MKRGLLNDLQQKAISTLKEAPQSIKIDFTNPATNVSPMDINDEAAKINAIVCLMSTQLKWKYYHNGNLAISDLCAEIFASLNQELLESKYADLWAKISLDLDHGMNR